MSMPKQLINFAIKPFFIAEKCSLPISPVVKAVRATLTTMKSADLQRSIRSGQNSAPPRTCASLSSRRDLPKYFTYIPQLQLRQA